jgi:hypothetical protein
VAQGRVRLTVFGIAKAEGGWCRSRLRRWSAAMLGYASPKAAITATATAVGQ